MLFVSTAREQRVLSFPALSPYKKFHIYFISIFGKVLSMEVTVHVTGENRFLMEQVGTLQQFIPAASRDKKIEVFSEVDKMPDRNYFLTFMYVSFLKQTGETHLSLPLASSSEYTARGPILFSKNHWAFKLKPAKSKKRLAQHGFGMMEITNSVFHLSSFTSSFPVLWYFSSSIAS